MVADDDNGQALHALQLQEEQQQMTSHVYAAINRVQAELAATGIGKDRKNDQQGYKFRGIDDVYNAVSRLLAKHGLCILPRCTDRGVVERTTQKGNALFYVTVRCEFDFVSAEDGSTHTVVTYGEAMDSADKATNKAMSAAYKYALMQAFAIPTEGDNDADATTHEVAAAPTPKEVADALKKLDAAAETGFAAVQRAMDELRPPLQAHLRAYHRADLASIKDAAAQADLASAPSKGPAQEPAHAAH